MEAKLGTRWVGKREGATLDQISQVLEPPRGMRGDLRLRRAHRQLILLHLKHHPLCWNHKTNLALTGLPLTAEDLKRIAEFE